MNIYKAINAVMQDCGAVGKDSKNTQQGYKFRGIDAVMNALNPAMKKNGIFVVPEVLEQIREERSTMKGGLLLYSICKVKYTFYADDGSSVEAVVIGEGMDSGDKATNKAMSAAFKYACFQTFCIPTEEMIDSEVDDPRPVSKEAAEDEQKRETVRKEKIGETRAKALAHELNRVGIKPETIFDLYKVKVLKDLTETQHTNIIDNIDKILEIQEQKSA